MEYEMMFRLLLASLFGGIIGYVREIGGKAAGLRTHMLVAVGSALFTIISIELARQSQSVDASRIASTVVTGIGFIGAGAIFNAGGSIRGLTTAASIWMCAALGMAVASGLYMISTFATILAFIVIEVLQLVEQKWLKSSSRKEGV